MAQTRFEYVKHFEKAESCLPNCWIVVRLDGKNFHRFVETHSLAKPNDKRSLDLLVRSARAVMDEIREIILAYGESDEFSFVFERKMNLYRRRQDKLLTTVCSHFTSCFVYYWKEYFSDVQLKYPPSFDGRIVLYPTNRNLRDYLSWRQADCHINNLYNTTFWALVLKGGCSRTEAEKRVRHTDSADKNELLHSEFNLNYNSEPEQFRKGTVILREVINRTQTNVPNSKRTGSGLLIAHCDIIGKAFWENNPHILMPE